MRPTVVCLALPGLILALAFVAAIGPGINNAVIAIALTAWPPYARVARAETLALREADFVNAARLQGAGAWRIILHQIVPLCLSSVIVRLPPLAGDHHHRGGARLPRPRRAAALAGMGHDDRLRPSLHPRPVVGGVFPRHGDLHRRAGLQPARRRVARRARPQAALTPWRCSRSKIYGCAFPACAARSRPCAVLILASAAKSSASSASRARASRAPDARSCGCCRNTPR